MVMAKLQDLIAKCDESEMFTQNLDENIIEASVQNNQGQITFVTKPELIYERLVGNNHKIGIVIWFPRDVFER